MGRDQLEVPGTERPVNKKIENAMQVLSDKKKAMTRARNHHKDAESKAIEVVREEMKGEKVRSYTSVDLGLTIDLDEVEKVKLSAYAPPEEKKKKSKAPEAEA